MKGSGVKQGHLRKWAILAVLLGAITGAGAQSRESPPPQIADVARQGQDAIYQLDFDKAGDLFQGLIRSFPDNPVGYGLYTNVTLNRLLFSARNLATDDYATPTPFSRHPTSKPIREESRLFFESVDRLFAVCDRRLREDPSDIQALYFKGLGYENRATEALAVRKNTGDARSHAKKARNLHKQVLRLDPDLVDAHVTIAVSEFAAATLPWSIKWFAFIIGERGDKDRALANLGRVARRGLYRRRDAQVILALLHAWKGRPQEAVDIFRELRRRYPRNFLSDVNLAAIYHLRLDDPATALLVYRELLADLDAKAPGIAPAEIHYRIGRVLLDLGQESEGLEAFRQASTTASTELETHSLAHDQIARIHERRGEKGKAKAAYREVLKYSGPEKVLEDVLRRARRKISQ